MAMLTSPKRLLLGVAVWDDFCVKSLLYFLQISRKPKFDLELTVSSEGQCAGFQQYIVRMEILSNFHALKATNTFLF